MGSRTNWWESSQKEEAQAEEVATPLVVTSSFPRQPGHCPTCGEPLTTISARKRKCKPCGYSEIDGDE